MLPPFNVGDSPARMAEYVLYFVLSLSMKMAMSEVIRAALEIRIWQ